MKRVRSILSVLLVVFLLISAGSAFAEGAETRSVAFYTAYERAEQAGLYVSIELITETQKRMKNRISQIYAGSMDQFETAAEDTAKEVVNNWFTSTHTNIATLFSVTEGSAGDLQISPDYLRMYDFVAITDAQGRVMFVPFQQYSIDLYANLCNEAVPVMESALLPTIQSCFTEFIATVEDTTAAAALQAAFDTAYPEFVVTLEDVKRVLTKEATVREGVTLESATNIVSDLSIGNLGTLTPVRVATENTDEAWYKLSLSETSLTGVRLSAPVPLSEIRNTYTSSATLWLNDAGELIYLTATQSWLSADASELLDTLAARGGSGTAVAATPEAKTDEKQGTNAALWYILSIVAAGALVAFLVLLVRKNNSRPRRAKTTGSNVPAQEDVEQDPYASENQEEQPK